MNIARTVSLIGLSIGWLAASQAFAATPSFSCAKTDGAAVKAICSDDTLAALDRETARLYGLARGTPGLSLKRKNELTAMQRGWIKGRDDCWKASDLKACIRDEYVGRIAELRAGYKGARGKGGVSIGPVAVTCPGSPAMNATFVNVEPPLAFLAGGDRSFVMTIARSGSGARYTAQYPQGEATFWQKGPEAIVQLPGDKEQTCRVGPLE
ncbi:MliC family protein [Variovorax sp. J22R24]|uniref:MliC family protein n=1 Tax=Variovorax gracilis TaxID=3053502 RepID=UPI002574C33F|nr:MliC family protein [Variovorax sp. J22R24]MDM0106935.1 MliC family protein [Variovorax sp. J22R24]